MLTITTFDWVPEMPRGYVRDIRPRWACEEAGLPYRIATVPSTDKSAAHLAIQPFHQVPVLQDDDRTIFESGAMTLYLGEKSPVLMPADEDGRIEVLQWALAALNSIEPPVTGWAVARFFHRDEASAARWEEWMTQRLAQLDAVLSTRAFIAAGRFTAADILMTEAVRMAGDEGKLAPHPAVTDYVARMTARPAFRKALADQLAHFAAAEAPAGAPAAAQDKVPS